MFKKTLMFLIFTGCLFSCVYKQVIPASASLFQIDEPDSISIPEPMPEPPAPTRAERVMRAISIGYPDKISEIEFRNNDWACYLNDKWFYFAEGKMLPENQLENAANFSPMQFYRYPDELPEWRELTAEEEERFRNRTSSRSQVSVQRSRFFLDDLLQAPDRTQTEDQLVRISFLGWSTRMHKSIQAPLALVEEDILTCARTDPLVRTWIDSLGTVDGYGWRNIADAPARSYHSYGLAIDFLPRTMGSRQTYWLWTSQYREDWWNVSYSERYHPPESVIKAFESHGFIWGGKWVLFDTMHFEYRPEILILNEVSIFTN